MDKYINWLRDMAEREEMTIRPCPKALRRAADSWEEDKQHIKELEEQLSDTCDKVLLANEAAQAANTLRLEAEAQLDTVRLLPEKWVDSIDSDGYYLSVWKGQLLNDCANEIQAALNGEDDE